jgi:predicted DNA-binding transcriptional regulator
MPSSTTVSNEERAILELLIADADAFGSVGEIARQLNLSPLTAIRAVHRMREVGLLRESWDKRPGATGSVYMPSWHPTDAGRDALADAAP